MPRESSANGDGRDTLTVVIDDLIAANAILSKENVIDAFGHVSSRHPIHNDRFLMSRARAPALVEASDIMEFDADGSPVDASGRRAYIERYIHAAIYAARPDARSVVHSHSHEVLPFTVSKTRLRPLAHTAGMFGDEVPVWEIREKFGAATNLLVSNLIIGRDLASRLGNGSAVLMRGHGAATTAASIRLATYVAITLNVQAGIQQAAMALGPVDFLTEGEISATATIFGPRAIGDALGRTWEYWCAKAGVPFYVRGA